MSFINARGASRLGDGFPSPWLDVASTAMPLSLKDLLLWCEFVFQNMGTYRRAQERIISYFLTDVMFESADPGESIDEDLNEKYTTIFKDPDRIDIMTVLGDAGVNRSCYGNDFLSMHVPFKRMLSCPQCGTQFPFNVVTDNPIFGFSWAIPNFVATCPKCKTGSGYRGPWKVNDLPDNLEKNLRIKHWRPHDIEIIHDQYSGENRYVWRIPADYAEQVRRGKDNLHVLEHCPTQVIKAIQHNQLFKFNPGVILHIAESPLAGVLSRGWGISRIMTCFRDIFRVQYLARYNEALCLDYICPVRVLTPAPRQGAGGIAGGQHLDPLLTDNMGDFKSSTEQMLRLNRRDPARWNVLPYPIAYQALGAGATEFAPTELLDQQMDIMLNASGAPAQLYRGDLQLQTAPVALRLFEADQRVVVTNNIKILNWAVEQVSQLLSWEPVRGTMKRVTTADDIQKTMMIMQMAMGGMVSKTEALDLLGLQYRTQARQLVEEARFEQELQAKVQEEMETGAFGQQIAKGGMGALQQMQQPQGQPGAGGAPAGGDPNAAAGGMAQGPVSQMVQSNNMPQTPEDMVSQAQSIATELLSLPDSQRRQELNQLREKSPAMHAIVRRQMDSQRNKARTQGAAMLLQGGGQQQQQPMQ